MMRTGHYNGGLFFDWKNIRKIAFLCMKKTVTGENVFHKRQRFVWHLFLYFMQSQKGEKK